MFGRVVRIARPSCLAVPKANYQNYVTSEILAQIERECERCLVPRVPPRKVAVVGAGSDVGRMASLFLKQQKIINVLSLYDEEPDNNVIGVATDLAHIDTSTTVEAYQGRIYMQDALYDSDVVLICGGHYVMPPCCCTLDRDLFFQNMQHVRTAAIACAQFCPQAVIAIQTPPVDCNFALCIDTLKLACAYDKRKVLGVNAINAMRANQLFCALTGTDPSTSITPVVGGTGRCTRVPVFSAAKAGNFPQKRYHIDESIPDPVNITLFTSKYGVNITSSSDGSVKNDPVNTKQTQVECLTRLVREADDIICRVKSNNEQGHLSIGFSTARFVLNVMKGLFERPTFIDSALVEQDQPDKCYDMPICASPVTVGKHGIEEYAIPTLNETEKLLLEDAKCDLEDMINLGSCYARGNEYCLHPCKTCPCCYYPPCPAVQPSGERKRG